VLPKYNHDAPGFFPDRLYKKIVKGRGEISLDRVLALMSIWLGVGTVITCHMDGFLTLLAIRAV